ncbi:MAG: hypothetical protein KGI38_11860 [Thaumarchaeota archaeon]|nr:hypothetical protein [Nitrososphaerota archaeon]
MCSGDGGFSRYALETGHQVFRFDDNPRFANVPRTFQKDVWDFDADTFADADVLLASPPCQWATVPSIGAHWTGGYRAYQPKDAETIRLWALAQHCLEIVRDSKIPIAVMEQLEGLSGKLLTERPTGKVWLCQYGDTRAKPTLLWGRFPEGFEFKKCHNGNPDHASAPRGSKTPGSTQGMKGSARRADMYFLGRYLFQCLEGPKP